MAERSVNKKAQSAVRQKKKRPVSSSKAERSKSAGVGPELRPSTGATDKHSHFLAKEEEYKLLNAELEAKTAILVQQAEQLIREQSEVLSEPTSTLLLLTDIDDAEDVNWGITSQQNKDPGSKVNKKRATSTSQMFDGTKAKESHCKTVKSSYPDESAAGDDSSDLFVAKTIRNLKEKMDNNTDDVHDNVVDNHLFVTGDNVGSAVSEAQVRVLKAKLGILQEEVDQLSSECYKKDDQNSKLNAKIKELEEDRGRLQRSSSIQQTQIQKHRHLAEESDRKCDALQLQVKGLNKEIESLKKSNKQAAAVHSATELRLGRALEEVDKFKTQLSSINQMKKDKMTEAHQSKDILLSENKTLKKQRAELIVAFKKQLQLIDILKRQKMHFEAAKLLSFTEEEFIQALDWGMSQTQ